jgi:translation initiation factor 2B subunit (eIF-2B alpha/beta/delta family)
LADADISLLRRGKPFSLVDQGLKTEWTIYPFAWLMKDGAKDIKIDWEHTEYRFVAPKDLANCDTVPKLSFGLGRVLVGPETERSLNALRNDHESGAQGLALLALDMLLKAVRGSDLAHIDNTEEFWRELRMIAWHLAKNGRPSMGAAIEAALFRTLDTIMAFLKGAGSDGIVALDLDTFKNIVESAIKERIATRKRSLGAVSQFFVRFIMDEGGKTGKAASSSTTTIVTLSSSGTLTQCLTDLIWTSASNDMNIKLCVLESRPKFEGAVFANALLDALEKSQSAGEYRDLEQLFKRLKIEIASDASVAMSVKLADYAVLGADKVLPNGDVINKIGSLTTSVMAKILNPECKVVVVFETDKITGASDDAEDSKVEYNDEKEVTNVWPSSVTAALIEKKTRGFQVDVKNAYFERVLATYIDQYISEKGALTMEDIRRLSVESDELEKRISRDV